MGYSNLAYELRENEEQSYSPSPKKIKVKKVKSKNFTPIVYALVLSMAAYYMISKNVALYETNQQIKSLEKQLTDVETYTSQRMFELEQSVDLSTIEQTAKSKLNMQRPEAYQIEYVSVEREDVTEVTAGDVEGFKNKLSRFNKNFKRNLIGIFSLGGK